MTIENAFIECALWSSTYESEGDTKCGDSGEHYLSDDSEAKLIKIASDFEAKFQHLFEPGNMTQQGAAEQAGHDLWLSSQGHGAGFWEDHDWRSDIGKILDKEAKAAVPEMYLYLNENGELDFE